mmetsp:Transcript_728/g.1109  ORF Transcript_728/g.1109 Transcript_728/m.1109 type:complete len:247 (+) Transcript_728:1124-1864(+)
MVLLWWHRWLSGVGGGRDLRGSWRQGGVMGWGNSGAGGDANDRTRASLGQRGAGLTIPFLRLEDRRPPDLRSLGLPSLPGCARGIAHILDLRFTHFAILVLCFKNHRLVARRLCKTYLLVFLIKKYIVIVHKVCPQDAALPFVQVDPWGVFIISSLFHVRPWLLCHFNAICEYVGDGGQAGNLGWCEGHATVAVRLPSLALPFGLEFRSRMLIQVSICCPTVHNCTFAIIIMRFCYVKLRSTHPDF